MCVCVDMVKFVCGGKEECQGFVTVKAITLGFSEMGTFLSNPNLFFLSYHFQNRKKKQEAGEGTTV